LPSASVRVIWFSENNWVYFFKKNARNVVSVVQFLHQKLQMANTSPLNPEQALKELV
jgi:hypothetical protein